MAKRGRPRHPDILTPREWDVLALVREGLTNEQIAERLAITERTARFHVSEILRKLGVSSRHEAAAWTPEERRAWWSFVIAPLSFGKAHRWLATAVASVTIAAGVGGVALLAWGITRTEGDGSSVSAVAPTATVEVAPPETLRWASEDSTFSIEAAADGSCGDVATALQYGIPKTLAVEGRVPSGDSQQAILGLESEPYPYRETQVSAPRGIGGQPVGWELFQRPPLRLGVTSVPQGAWTGPTELFLRRLEQPGLLFRYATENCEQADNFSPLLLADLETKEVLELPPQLPAILEREQGDYISAQEAIRIAEQAESRSLSFPASSQGPNNLKGERVVWAELAKNDELSIPNRYLPRDVLWLIVFELGDTAGPLRPGHILGRYYTIYAESGTVQMQGACCVRLKFND